MTNTTPRRAHATGRYPNILMTGRPNRPGITQWSVTYVVSW
jgi:hypothetical protein